MQGFKYKLKKDLKIIQNIFVKIIGAFGIGLLLAFNTPQTQFARFNSETNIIILFTVISFILLYLLDAWLYGEDELKDDSV